MHSKKRMCVVVYSPASDSDTPTGCGELPKHRSAFVHPIFLPNAFQSSRARPPWSVPDRNYTLIAPQVDSVCPQ